MVSFTADDFACVCSLVLLMILAANAHHCKLETKTASEREVENGRNISMRITDLSFDCIQLILDYLSQEDVINLMLVNKQLHTYCRSKLFLNVYVTLKIPIKPIASIPDISTNWTFITPNKFWKMINLYHFNPELVKNLFIDQEILSTKFLERYVFSTFRTSRILLDGITSNISPKLVVVNVKEDEIQAVKNLPNLRKLTVISGCDTNGTGASVYFGCKNVTELILIGDPLRIQKHFVEQKHIAKLTLIFQNSPPKTTITSLNVPMDNIKEFQLKFDATYFSKERPNFVEDIEYDFMKKLKFPKLKKLSISSQDNKYSCGYKYLLPKFYEFISTLPPLDVLHLSIGSENNFSVFLPDIINHQNSLKRFAWVGNINEQFYPKIELLGNLRFDMINGNLLVSPVELGRRRYYNQYCENEEDLELERIFKDSMIKLGKSRGNNYFQLNDYNYCKGEIFIEKALFRIQSILVN